MLIGLVTCAQADRRNMTGFRYCRDVACIFHGVHNKRQSSRSDKGASGVRGMPLPPSLFKKFLFYKLGTTISRIFREKFRKSKQVVMLSVW